MSAEIVQSVLQFLSLFENEIPQYTKPESLSQLSDGQFLSRFLSFLEPSHFDLDSFSDSDSSESIQNLIVSLETFLEANMGKVVDLTFISIEKITREKDEQEILKLLELVVLCAINSAQKELVVNHIMSMSDGDQAQLMFVINEITNEIGAGESGSGRPSIGNDIDALNYTDAEGLLDDSQLNTSLKPLTSSPAASNTATTGQSSYNLQKIQELEDSIHSLEQSKEELQIRLTTLEREKKESMKREGELKRQCEELIHSKEEEIRDARVEAMEVEKEKQLELRKQEMKEMTRQIKELEHKMGEVKVDLKRQQEVTAELQREKLIANELIDELKGKLSGLKDELQIATAKSELNAQLEAKVQRLQQRLDQAGDAKAQVEYAEEQAQKSLEKIIALESQIKEIPTLKSQIQKYKEQIVQYQQKSMDSNLEMERKEGELRELKDEMEMRRSELRGLQEELKSMKSECETWKARAEESGYGALNGINGEMDSSIAGGLSLSLKEQNKRLEYELKQLKLELESRGDTAELQNELDIAKTMADSNKEKYLEAARKISALESQVRKLESSAATAAPASAAASGEEVEKMKKDLGTAQETISALRKQLQQAQSQSPASGVSGGAALGASALASIPGLGAAQMALNSQQSLDSASQTAKLEALTIRNKKLETFVKHTQKKLKLLEEMNSKSTAELNVLKESNRAMKLSIQERDKELLEKEKMRLEDMAIANRERRLMSSAFYALGMDNQIALMTGKAAGRSGAAAAQASRSWLNQQRAARGGEN